jgi:hypothetical protein
MQHMNINMSACGTHRRFRHMIKMCRHGLSA